LSRRRVGAVLGKELREYGRKRSVVVSMGIFPLIFVTQPAVVVFLVPASAGDMLSHGHLLLYMLGIPILTPTLLAAYAIAGERQVGSLEPVLTTPIRRDELLLAKALAVLLPSALIAYVVYGLFVAAVAAFAQPAVAAAVLRPSDVAAQLLLTPLLALLPIWLGMAISTRVDDVRVGQQLTLLGSVPLAFVAALIALGAVAPTTELVIVLLALMLIGDLAGWRVVARLFDRERLIVGTR
jgi:ABC-type transport system involved in multi-copper enzyme maturation permease subunit